MMANSSFTDDQKLFRVEITPEAWTVTPTWRSFVHHSIFMLIFVGVDILMIWGLTQFVGVYPQNAAVAIVGSIGTLVCVYWWNWLLVTRTRDLLLATRYLPRIDLILNTASERGRRVTEASAITEVMIKEIEAESFSIVLQIRLVDASGCSHEFLQCLNTDDQDFQVVLATSLSDFLGVKLTRVPVKWAGGYTGPAK
ncbi:MAG TPA: hypothetical protein VGK19_08700 [Capsulimonadaceae bacterium]|jgi:hypothetical protein